MTANRQHLLPLLEYMECTHRGFHTISSSYDRAARILTYFRRCESCGSRLGDVAQLDYQPQFDPYGNDQVLPVDDLPAVETKGSADIR